METTGKLTIIEWKKPIRLVIQLLILFLICSAVVFLGKASDLVRQSQDPAYKNEVESEHQSQVELDEKLRQIELSHHH